MTSRTRRAGTVTLVVAASALACAQAAAWVTPPPSTTRVSTAGLSSDDLATVSVAASGLYPGRTVLATLLVTNTGDTPLRITTISAAASPRTNDCSAGSVASPRLHDPNGLPRTDAASSVLAPDDTGTWTVPVTLTSPAETACAGQVFRLPVLLSSQAAS